MLKVTRDCDNKELLRQIGAMNVFAISGGRVGARRDGVDLPVASGYSVRVTLMADDTYTVERIYTRSGVESVKKSWVGVYCEEVGEVAYQASCFRSN